MFLAYLLINLVNCRFLSHPITVCKNKFNTHFFCFYAAVFIKLKLRPDVSCTTPDVSLLRRDVVNATSGRIFTASERILSTDSSSSIS